MKKGIKIALISAVTVIIILAIVAYLAVFTTATRTAYLLVEQNGVQVDTGNGWNDAVDLMELSLDDKVRTNNGEATVVFYDSIIVNLDKNTEVEINALSNENVKITQKSGSTWHKFTRLVGIGDYKVQTPNAVATIRGTEAGIEVNEDNESMMLGEGDIEIEFRGEKTKLDPLQVLFIAEDGSFYVKEMNLAQKRKTLESMTRNMGMMKKVRMNEIEHHSGVVDRMMKKYGDEGKSVETYMNEIDRGELDDNAMVEKSPVKIPALHKVKGINDEIKKSQWTIRQIESGKSSQEIKRGIENKEYLSR